ncbi:YihY/virulence factor BrkB family protein [Nocardia sp. NPDC003693]
MIVDDRRQRLWFRLLRGTRFRLAVYTLRAAWSDRLSDWAASLTFYSMLALFPAVLIAVVILGMLGTASGNLASVPGHLGPDEAQTALTESLEKLQAAQAWSLPAIIVGVASAIWTVSSYLGAFIRATNDLYGVRESRSARSTLTLRLVLTGVVVGAIVAAVIGFALTNGFITRWGEFGATGITVGEIWRWCRWPALAAAMSVVLAILYWLAPNVTGQRFRAVTAGSLFAVGVGIIGSTGLSQYVAHVGSFNRLYGTLAAAVVVLVWMWLVNFAILLGATLDAQIARQRLLAGSAQPDPAEHSTVPAQPATASA